MSSKVSMYNQALQTGDTPVFQQELISPNVNDVSWFSEAFSAIGREGNIGDKVVEQLQSSADNLKAKREDLNEQFKSASKNDSYVDLVNTSRMASEYGFQTALMAKVISKSTQSVEKLTNLQ